MMWELCWGRQVFQVLQEPKPVDVPEQQPVVDQSQSLPPA